MIEVDLQKVSSNRIKLVDFISDDDFVLVHDIIMWVQPNKKGRFIQTLTEKSIPNQNMIG